MVRRHERVIRVVFSRLLAATAADAECFADYKAKQDDPLRLHYGVIELPDAACGSRDAARREVAQRMGRDGWQLLSIDGIFGEEEANARKQSAGKYFLRY